MKYLYNLYKYLGGLLALVYFVLIAVLIFEPLRNKVMASFNVNTSFLIKLFLILFAVAIVMVVLHLLVFSKYSEKNAEQINRSGTGELFYSFFLPIIVGGAIGLSLWSKGTNLWESVIIFIVLVAIFSIFMNSLLRQAKQFKEFLNKMGLKVSGDIVPFSPKPIIGQGTYKGIKTQIVMFTKYRAIGLNVGRVNTNSEIKIEVETSFTNNNFIISYKNSNLLSSDQPETKEINNYIVKSNNSGFAESFLENNEPSISNILNSGDAVYLNYYPDQSKNGGYFHEQGFLGTIIENKLDLNNNFYTLAQLLEELVGLSQNIPSSN